ncbi:organic hydroperoxide resistance protein [Spirillospora sp. NPDC000708]|jgi:Ohr subfamily peroxiredoxin|uniref:organic hydroperoxide resistance protein n=1 Tax=Actinomadura TaxID=1988 RepID=UPI00168524BE|nr:organic hydroperoxide resistance protein [Actinomadura sp. RB99]MBD2897740.1 Organic hydroperoxide resistance protein OhrB [Actinomadura sp. RB99]
MDTHYTAVATANGREGRAVSSDGRLDLTLAPPREMGGSGAGTNPEQLFAAGYAACFASALGAVARGSRQDVRDVSVTAEVGIGGSVEKGFGLSVVLRVELPDGLENGRELVERAHQVCPYSNATRGNIPVELVIE